jgi:hypothetical protein
MDTRLMDSVQITPAGEVLWAMQPTTRAQTITLSLQPVTGLIGGGTVNYGPLANLGACPSIHGAWRTGIAINHLLKQCRRAYLDKGFCTAQQ